jgi:hypothetical protein
MNKCLRCKLSCFDKKVQEYICILAPDMIAFCKDKNINDDCQDFKSDAIKNVVIFVKKHG